MIDLQIDFDTRELDQWEIFNERQKRSTLKVVAAHYMLLQRQRVNRGESLAGGQFKDYSPGYRDRKTRAGRMGESFWMRLSGQMLRSQHVTIDRRGDTLQARVFFDGTRPVAKIVDPAKRSAYRRTSRSQRGSFEGDWRRGRAKREQRRARAGRGIAVGKPGYNQRMASRLTVALDSGRMVSNAQLAARNDLVRPFVGMNRREVEELIRVFKQQLFSAPRGS